MAETHPLILSLRSAGLKEVDTCNLDEVHNIWAALSRAKNCIDGGDRLEYLSWRIYSREILARKPSPASFSTHTDANVEPPPGEEDAPSEMEHSGSDSDYESYSGESDSETVDRLQPKPPVDSGEVRETRGPPQELKRPSVSVAPRPVSTMVHPHRRISSLELQRLFKDTRKLDPSSLRKCALSVQERSPALSKASESIDSARDSNAPASSAYQRRFGGTGTPRAAANGLTRNFSRSLYDPLPDEGASTAVRGFSPSSVSVSVSMNRGFNTKGYTNDVGADEDHEDDSELVTWKKAPLPREKIFFIEAESDSEVSSAGSVENQDRRLRKNAVKEAEPVKSVRLNAEDQVYGSSGWDDTSDEDFNDGDDEGEDGKENMFKERAVPSKPLLKRSLLSSLFVNGIKDRSLTPEAEGTRDSPEPLQVSASPSDHETIAAPVDILLGAVVAPHIPLPVASPRTVRRDMLNTELSQSLRDNMKQSRNYDVDLMFRQRPSASRSFSESAAGSSVSESSDAATPGIGSLHIKARPEMYRASTDNGVSYRRPSEERSTWQSQHEDIYDPMNYHSRGW